MCINGRINPTSMEGLVVRHVHAMRDYAVELEDSLNPYVSRKKVVKRIRKCATELADVYERILELKAAEQKVIDRYAGSGNG